MRNLYIEHKEQEVQEEERQQRQWKFFIAFVEACWVAFLVVSCVAVMEVINGH